MRITKVYTKTGDQGETGLAGGQRVPKDALRIEAYGTVDELNSHVGVARTLLQDPGLDADLERIQHDLFDLGGDLCVLEPDKVKFGMKPFAAERVAWLEERLDAGTAEIPPLEEFILPAGEPASAALHVARTVARRAERCCVSLAREEDVSDHVIPYLNRLSDFLFVAARLVNHRSGRGDVLWQKTHKRGQTQHAQDEAPPAPPSGPEEQA
jgi:cob(I)alamin adenosyltransferase